MSVVAHAPPAGVPGTPRRAATAGRWLYARLVEHPVAVTTVLCAAVVLAGVGGSDLPAQDYRTWLFRTHGAILWDDRWYAGHALPGYSLLFPPLAALLGARVVGAAACIASTAALRWLLREGDHPSLTDRRARDIAVLWFSVVTVVDLVVGRLPFALGLALGLLALAATRRRRTVLAAVAALCCGAASPLAAAFLLLVGFAWGSTVGWRRVGALLPAVGGLGVALLFGESGGRFPFPAGTLVTVLVFVALGLWLGPRDVPALRRGLLLYGAAAVALFLVPNPVGGNVIRLGAVAAGPLAALELRRLGRTRMLGLLAAPLLFWQLQPVPAAVASVAGDPSSRPAYYTGLLSYLLAHGGASSRVEIPLTRDHWETAYVAPRVALARGWERQTDLAHNGLLYQSGLDRAAYRSWLVSTGVGYVALPDVPLDPSAAPEAALLHAPPAWLRPVWHDAHWKLWAVLGTTPLVTGAARLSSVGVSSFSVVGLRAGWSTVLLRWTDMWTVLQGDACVLPSADGWTRLLVLRPGPVSVGVRLDLGRLAAGSGSCDAPTTAG